MKVSQTMFTEYDYDIAILGNDSAGLRLAQRACTEFTRVVLIAEETVWENAPAGLDVITGVPEFESDHVVVCETTQGRVSVSAAHIVIATGSTAIPPRWMIDHPSVQIGEEVNSSIDSSGCIAIADRDSIELISADQSTQLDCCIIGLSEEESQIRVFLESGESILVDSVLAKWSAQRGKTSFLNLEAAGLSADDHGCLWCNGNYETWTDGIFAIGRVVGYPAPACGINEQIDFVMNSIRSSRYVSV